MSCKIEFVSFVKIELKEIGDWYKNIDKKLALDFYNEYQSKIEFIAENPSTAEIKYDGIRISYLKKFPFGIHYQYNKNENLVLIISVYHTSRIPKN